MVMILYVGGLCMANNDSELLNQERQRRKRINRMKTGIIMTIAIWMLVSLLAIIILSVQVFQLNKQMVAISTGGIITGNNTGIQNVEEQALDEESYANVVTGIDTEDNFAAEGDVHKVYLTFNSVPGDNTNDILDVLAQYDVKATFFVTGQQAMQHPEWYQAIVDEGHTLGMHSYSHRYNEIYES